MKREKKDVEVMDPKEESREMRRQFRSYGYEHQCLERENL
jgi:hypothetical protein